MANEKDMHCNEAAHSILHAVADVTLEEGLWDVQSGRLQDRSREFLIFVADNVFEAFCECITCCSLGLVGRGMVFYSKDLLLKLLKLLFVHRGVTRFSIYLQWYPLSVSDSIDLG